MIIERRKFGFTLVEMMAASVVTSFIILVAVSGLSSTVSSRSRVEEATITADELRYASESLVQDLRNVLRDRQTKMLEGSFDEETGCRIRFRAVRHHGARMYQPEGDLYEVEYFIVQDGVTSQLARRVCPIVGVETDPLETDGGILTKLTDRIAYFSIRYFDGSQWVDQWPVEQQQLPMLIEVSFAVRVGDEEPETQEELRRQLYTRQVLINIPRSGMGLGLTSEQLQEAGQPGVNNEDMEL